MINYLAISNQLINFAIKKGQDFCRFVKTNNTMARRGTVTVTNGKRSRNVPEAMLPQFEKKGYFKAESEAPEPVEAKASKNKNKADNSNPESDSE